MKGTIKKISFIHNVYQLIELKDYKQLVLNTAVFMQCMNSLAIHIALVLATQTKNGVAKRIKI